MALNDPISLNFNPTWAAPTGGTATSWRRISDGMYVAENLGTVDEPFHIIVKNGAPSRDSEHRFEVQVRRQKNLPVGMTGPDDIATVSFVCRYVPRSFSPSEIQALVTSLVAIVAPNDSTNTMLRRLMLGEK